MKAHLLAFALFACMPLYAQDVNDKFTTDVCGCMEKIKLEATTSQAIETAIEQCFETAISTYKKELKKKGGIDWDKGATEEQVTEIWQQIFKKCPTTANGIFEKKEKLEEALVTTSFQGIVIYVQDIELAASMKKLGITKEQMIEEMKNEGKWVDTLYAFFRGGNYAYIGNNKAQTQKVYVSDENIIYSYSAIGDGICSVQEAVDLDLNGAPDKPTIVELDTTVTIMNLPCKAIRMKWKLGQFDYYYNPGLLNANPELFKQHTSEGLAQFVSMTKCLPVQIVKSIMGMKVIQTATSVKAGEFDLSMLSVPELVEDEELNVIKLPGIKMMRIKE